MFPFEEFPKIPRLKREVVITEKIDGTNAQVALFEIREDVVDLVKADASCLTILPGASDGDTALALYAGSRSRWLQPTKTGDNFGFARWVLCHALELAQLGPGRHYGEWYGAGIQRGYGLDHKRFALFNTARWSEVRPACCDVVPVLMRGEDVDSDNAMFGLHINGSSMVPGFNNPEGIVVYHSASRQLYKRTFDQDGGKWRQA
jgi:hypothetical protein